jgi:hypothetical protein
MTLHTAEALIIVTEPKDVNAVTAALIDNDCAVEMLDHLSDPCGPTTWLKATVITAIDPDSIRFCDWLEAIVAPWGGFADEWGYPTDQEAEAALGEDAWRLSR